jgi:hypothetical protein
MTVGIQMCTKIFINISLNSGGHEMANKVTSFVSMFHVVCDEHCVDMCAKTQWTFLCDVIIKYYLCFICFRFT